MLRSLSYPLALAPAWLLPATTLAEADERLLGEIRREVAREMRREDVPGVAIALVDDRDILFSSGFGTTGAEPRSPIGERTPFPAGDLTKLITAIAVLQQVERGTMALDAPVTRYVPDLEIHARFSYDRAPTLRELLSHRSGLPNNVHAGSYQDRVPDAVTPVRSVYLSQPPGMVYAYSNISFVILGHALEAVTNQPYEEYVRANVLEPLGMTDSGFQPTDGLALPHDERGRPMAPIYSRDLPALGMIASIRDIARLARWFLAEDTGPVLPRRWVDEMARIQNADVALDVDNRIGLVWQLTNTGRHNVDSVLRINSFMTHYRGILLIAPNERLAVAAMANSENAGQMVIEAGELAMNALLESRRSIPRPAKKAPVPDVIDLPRGARAEPLAARYNTPIGEVVFEPNGRDDIEMQAFGRLFGLERRDDGWHELSFKLFGFIKLRFSVLREVLLRSARIDSHQLLLAYFRGHTYVFGATIPKGRPLPDAQAWSGRYRLTNPDVFSDSLDINEIELEASGDRLHVSYELRHILKMRPRLPALHLGDLQFFIPGVGTNMGDQLSLEKTDGKRTLRYSNWVFEQQ